MTGPAAEPGRLRAPRRTFLRPSAINPARALDEALFAPTGWFALDRANVRVPGVRPGSLDAALALVGQGAVATVVGRLRPGVAVVDVDAGDAAGDAVADALVSWCTQQEIWHLARPSGGGPGRWHVFCVPGAHYQGLVVLLEGLRVAHGLRGAAVDLRRAVRPLSAPHRITGPCLPSAAPSAALAAALAGLRRALGRSVQSVSGVPLARRAPESSSTPSSTLSSTVEAAHQAPAAVPLPRSRRDLPAAWATYLATGCPPDAPVGASGVGAGDRSLTERLATYALVVAGHDEPSAWEQVTTAHSQAFAKARQRGRAWWTRYVWADAVRAADAWLTTQPRLASGDGGRDDQVHRVDQDVLAATAAARAALTSEWLGWGRDERHSMRAVLEVLLERMERTGSTTVPCPERDLLLDTPLGSRTTVRKALARLQEARFGVRRATFSPAAAAAHRAAAHRAAACVDHTLSTSGDNGSRHDSPDGRSHTWELAERFTARPAPTLSGRAVRQVDPPWSHTPPPPVGIWREVGLAARSAYLALPEGFASPLPLSDLAVSAGAVHGPEVAPTASQLRTLADHLAVLAGHGLALVDAHGRWRRAQTPLPGWIVVVAAARQQAVAAAVAGERAAYAELAGAGSRWARGRAAALGRQAKADVARRRAWWQALDSVEREARRTARAQAFTDRPVREQEVLKASWATARTRAGASEAERHDAWIAALPLEEYTLRVATRTAAYAALPPPLQAAAAAAWAAHRARYDISRGAPLPAATYAPVGATPTGALLIDLTDASAAGTDPALVQFALLGAATGGVPSRFRAWAGQCGSEGAASTGRRRHRRCW